MHKKPLVAVLIFGLLLLVNTVGFAKADAPYTLNDDGQLLPNIARGLVKDAPTALTASPGPTTNLQLGVSRTGATFCDGQWQGAAAGYYGSWYYGDEAYASYQDPENLGTCTGLSDVYTFDVTAINWWVYEQVGGTDYDMQPLVFDNAGDAICPLPGMVLCAGPVYAVNLPSIGGYILSLPFVDPCCTFNDYFAGVYSGPYYGPGILGIEVAVPAAGGGNPQVCYNYNDYGGGWIDLSGSLAYDLMLWSEGDTYDQNTCPGLPGVCDWVSYYNGIAVYSQDPNVNGETDRFVRFNPDVECTLVTADLTVYGGGSVGTPTLTVRVYGNNGPVFAGRMYPGAFGVYPDGTDPNVIFEVDIPWAGITTYPGFTSVDFSTLDPNWPTGYVYTTGENLFISQSLSANTPDPVNDVIAFLLDAGPSNGHNGDWVGVFGDYYYNDEVFATTRNLVMDAYFCCQFVPVAEVECSNPGPDDWPTWAHDYNRTSATSINVGDPCEIRASWTQPLVGDLNGFCEPTIANNTVYVSTESEAFSFDLSTGAPGNTIAGLPYIFAQNRGNMTSHGGFVYVTGGNAQSISQWDPAFTAANWVNGIGVGAGALGDRCRFGVTAVYDIAGTEVVVVGTEHTSSSGGRLWCYETATGAIYPGWATNPVILPEGIFHSPAYDGTDLYVGTGNSSLAAGEIYRIDAATGAILWTYTPTITDEGYPGGVSLEGNFVYAASYDGAGGGSRVKIDKGTGLAVWEFPETDALYGAPAIGRNFVYINQEGNGTGVLVVDKATGAALYNFAANGVGQVTQPVTITCDNYLFAGDRSGSWWLLNVNDQVAEFSVPFDGVVNGTAIANDGVDDFAVVSIRSGNSVDGGGLVAAFKFNAGPRPRVAQDAPGVDIPVPFGTGPGQPFTQADLFSNVGCADLNIGPINITDPAPDVSSKKLHNEQSRYAAALANAIVGADYTAYFDNSTKAARIANRPLQRVNEELNRGDVAIESAQKALVDSKRSGSRMAAGAQFLRTSAVTVTTPLAAGSSTDVDWVYDGTNLKRGIDVEELEFITDDPDRIFFGNQPIFTITYIGGCLDDELHFVWNTDGAANEENIYNYGSIADDDSNDDFVWGADPEDGATLYDGSFFLAGSQATGNTDADSSQFYIGNMYEDWDGSGFAGNPKPGTDICGFDEDADVHMGWKRTGGCPGTPAEILGGWARAYYVDTIQHFGDTPYGAIGTEITFTKVGAYDPDFGDFAIMKWDITERNGVAQGPLYGGTWADWDIPPNGGTNHGIVSDNFNGYALWDWVTPSYAFGYLDPRMSTDYCGLNTAEYSPHRIQTMGQRCDDGSDGCGGYGLWQGDASGTFEAQSLLWDNVINGAAREVGPHENGPGDLWNEDHFGLLVNTGFDFAGNDTKSVIQAEYGVDVSDIGAEGATDVATAEARITELARRAAIWTGFARGDVNMDGCVNLIDVCWLGSPNQIYPDDYNGDVNLSGGVDGADASYLLNYVTGLGPAPQGEWRFTF